MDSPLFQLDETACVACGACVRDCAFRALARGDDGRPVFAHPERCMRCQHCFAICPTGAIAFDGRRAADARGGAGRGRRDEQGLGRVHGAGNGGAADGASASGRPTESTIACSGQVKGFSCLEQLMQPV